MSKTNSDVIRAWYNGNPAKSSNGNLSTNGSSLFSYAMEIGRTLTSGEKQVLAVYGYNTYSATTSQHVSAAIRRGVTIVQPVSCLRGYGIWYVFPDNGSITVCRATRGDYKTFNGAHKALARHNNPKWFVQDKTWGEGYYIAYRQFLNHKGEIVDSDMFYNEE